MAKIEDLFDEIANPVLAEWIANEVKDPGETKRYDLVFEEHFSLSAATEACDTGSQAGSQ